MANITKGKTFTTNEEVTAAKLHQLVDSASIANIQDSEVSALASASQGDVLYRGASAWAKLAAGAANKFLMTSGASANPAWENAPNFKIGTFSKDVSNTSDTTVTGVGFTPRLVILFGVIQNTHVMTFGVDDGTTHYAILMNETNDSWTYDDSYSIVDVSSDTDVMQGAISAFSSDGFTVQWTKSGTPTGTLVCRYVAIM